MNTQLTQTCLLVLAESILILIHNNMVITDSVSMDFRLLQTSFPVQILWRTLDTSDNCAHNCDRYASLVMTAVSPTVRS